MKPKVSIIMATFNRAHFIVESLLSIQKQTFLDWECLIIDDGGTDNTKEIISPILENDNRFVYKIRHDNYLKGLPGCRNYGLDLAQGEYIIFFDDDDIAHPQNLEICVHELDQNDISFCRYVREVFVNDFAYNFEYSKIYTFFSIDKKDLERMLKNELQFNSCAVMWKVECFDENRFKEELMFAEEWELYSRIVSSGFSGISINKTLFYGRKHPQSNTGEYHRKSTFRKASYAEAVLFVVHNLKEKQLLTNSLKRCFVTFSIEFKEYNLFNKVITVFELSTFEKIKWQIFYVLLPLRLKLYRTIRAIKK